ncbi:type VII toxin-antitoxin system HepT family RNase toxin [Candidatus Hakubella thermalkaliphila]|nr:HepT-like ribonuclease domain-containing protein [Candidatus Hakubella thermalkaliphila]
MPEALLSVIWAPAKMVDKTLIIRKIVLISKDCEALKSLAQLSYEDYVAEPTNEVLAERYLERMIGRMIDINYHLITEKGHPPPPDYFQSFLKLAEIKILPFDLVQQIAPCAGLRNRIVHEYDEIDTKKVYEGLQAAMRDIPLYLSYISKFIEE